MNDAARASRSTRARGATRPASSTRRRRARPRRRSPRSAARSRAAAASTRRTRAGATRAQPTRSPRRSARPTAPACGSRCRTSCRATGSRRRAARSSSSSGPRRAASTSSSTCTRASTASRTSTRRCRRGRSRRSRRASAELLRDPAARDRMRPHRSILSAGDDWSRIVLLDNPFWPQYARRDLASIAAERGQEPLDAVYDLLLGALEAPHRLMVIIHAYTEDEQREAFAHPLCVPGLRRDDPRARRPARRHLVSTAPTRGRRGSTASWSATSGC